MPVQKKNSNAKKVPYAELSSFDSSVPQNYYCFTEQQWIAEDIVELPCYFHGTVAGQIKKTKQTTNHKDFNCMVGISITSNHSGIM